MKGRLGTIYQFLNIRENLEAEYKAMTSPEQAKDSDEVFDTSFLES